MESPGFSDDFRPLPARLDLAVDPVLEPPAPGQPAPATASPVSLAAGRRIAPLLVETQRVTLAGLRILDPAGIVVASSGSEDALSLAQRDEVARALRGEVVRLLRRRELDHPLPPLDSISRSARVRVWVALPVLEQGRVWGAVLLNRTPTTVAQSLYGIRAWIAAAALILITAVALLAAVTSRTVTRPVAELIRRTQRVAAGDREAARPLEHAGTREIGELSEAFARMASTLDARASYITGFAASVSHEFKTPLASMHGTVEILRDHVASMSSEERGRFLGNLEADVERLDRLVRGLLELARADVLQPGDARADPVALAQRLAARTPLRLELPAADGTLAARISPEALEALLLNLVENARDHGGPGTTVTLRITSAPQEGRRGLVLEVEDDGGGISEANLGRIFEPFFTTARGRGGTGLGLAVVRSLVRAHGGSIGVASRTGSTRFRVWLPAG